MAAVNPYAPKKDDAQMPVIGDRGDAPQRALRCVSRSDKARKHQFRVLHVGRHDGTLLGGVPLRTAPASDTGLKVHLCTDPGNRASRNTRTFPGMPHRMEIARYLAPWVASPLHMNHHPHAGATNALHPKGRS
jgi:hypothetical protein